MPRDNIARIRCFSTVSRPEAVLCAREELPSSDPDRQTDRSFDLSFTFGIQNNSGGIQFEFISMSTGLVLIPVVIYHKNLDYCTPHIGPKNVYFINYVNSCLCSSYYLSSQHYNEI